MLSAQRLVGLLAEPERRRVVAALILGAGPIPEVAERAGLDLREASDAIDRLDAAGLVERGSDGTIILLEECFKQAARSDGAHRRPPPGETTDERVLNRCIGDNGRLVHIPRKRSHRLVLLDHLAQRFEPGVHYGEREVNRILRAFDDDTATLRRYLVDERFLDRSDGEYWRSGGTVT